MLNRGNYNGMVNYSNLLVELKIVPILITKQK